MTSDPTAALVVTALLEICRQFGITLIAEGVETDHELAMLKKLGVSHAQGYLLGHPSPLTTRDSQRSIHPRDSD